MPIALALPIIDFDGETILGATASLGVSLMFLASRGADVDAGRAGGEAPARPRPHRLGGASSWRSPSSESWRFFVIGLLPGERGPNAVRSRPPTTAGAEWLTSIRPRPVLAQRLIRADSVTPAGPAVFDIVEDALAAAGFAVERHDVRRAPARRCENLFATRGCGPASRLRRPCRRGAARRGATRGTHAPFGGEIDGDTLYGRGAQDMKGAVAAMIVAAVRLGRARARRASSPSSSPGTRKAPRRTAPRPLMAWAAARGRSTPAIVGEPTSRERLGDTIKIGRRGSHVRRR